MKSLFLTTAILLFIFDLNAKIIYVEPVQNAKYVNINNSIIIGFDEMIVSSDISSLINVTGSISGIHQGEIILTADKRKILFKPYQPFAFNEKIEVKLNRLKTTLNSNNRLMYTFYTQISKPDVDYKKLMDDESEYSSNNNYVYSDNYATLPQLTVAISNNPSPGQLFFTNTLQAPYTPYLIIVNNDGTPYYNRELPLNVVDFSRQKNGLYTYFTGIMYYAEDSDHNVVDSFYCGNKLTTDFHDLRLLNNGHALLLSYDAQLVDMSQLIKGGDTHAVVVGLIVQEIDENKDVVFQWRSWDHFNIIDAIYQNLTTSTIDYVHGNALEFDNDGNILLSSRHLNEITKIDRSTGDLIWRLGGVNNQFTFVNDTIPFHYQHHIRRIDNGNITLYDNGNFRTPLFSRAVEYNLDEENKIATLVWQYRHDPVTYGPNRGSVQRLINGNTLIGWGGGVTNPTMTEVTPAGDIALEMSLPQDVISYRVFRDEMQLTLNIKIAIEGIYNNVSDKLNLLDTVRAFVRSVNSPYNIIDSAKSVVDSVNFNGNFRFFNVPTGVYYISTKHRNGLETWSKSGGESFTTGGVYSYDFTNSSSEAFGNNVVLKGSKYCFFSGDVDQEGHIDLTDVIIISNNATNFVTGYVNTDVNGDNITDLTDVLITYNNSTNFVLVVRP